jgi:phage shock protein A
MDAGPVRSLAGFVDLFVCSFRKPRFTALRSAYNSAWVNAMKQPSIATMQDILIALEQDPNLQREFHKHLVEVIRRDDHLRQDLRKEILAEELLQLPTRFTRVEDDMAEVKQDVAVLKEDMAEVKQDVAVLKEDMAEVKQDVAVLKGDMAEVKEDMAEVKGDTSRMAGQIANLMGSDYETKAIERSRRLIRRALGMERATLVYASRQPATDFEEQVLVPAIRQGLIDRQQADQLEEADSIIRCENDQGDIIHAVVEISITVQDHDRARATDRAAIFNLATGLRVLPFVVGQNQQERGANAPNVPFLEYRD